jgi:hypothetical protein
MIPAKKLYALFALALMASALAAPSSSADSLCKKLESPCSTNAYPVGTAIESALPAEAKFHFTGSLHSVDCTKSTMSAQLTAFASPLVAGVPFLGEIITENFESCKSPTAGTCQTFKTKSIAAPVKFFASTKTAGDGFLNAFAGAKEIEMACSSLACTWEYLAVEEFPYVRTFQGGSPPTETLKVTYVYKAGSFLCGKTFVAEGTRQLTSPTTAFWMR